MLLYASQPSGQYRGKTSPAEQGAFLIGCQHMPLYPSCSCILPLHHLSGSSCRHPGGGGGAGFQGSSRTVSPPPPTSKPVLTSWLKLLLCRHGALVPRETAGQLCTTKLQRSNFSQESGAGSGGEILLALSRAAAVHVPWVQMGQGRDTVLLTQPGM